MAVTATAQSAFTSDLSWDEAIVPTLRKRLEHESRAISKRMSAHSIAAAGDDGPQPPSARRTAARPSIPHGKPSARPSLANSTSAYVDRPSAIPRPSLNYTRPLLDSSNVPSSSTSRLVSSKADSRKQQQQQQQSPLTSRAYGGGGGGGTGGNGLSQAHNFTFDSELTSAANGPNAHSGANSNHPSTRTTNALPTPASSRSNSPVLTSTPYKNNKTKNNNSNSNSNKVASSSWDDAGRTTPTYNRHLQGQASNRIPPWEEDDIDDYYGSYSSSIDMHHSPQQNGIIQEEAPPFTANSSYVSDEAGELGDVVRPSLEERPFEHWYRGDLSRNGGVGELRIGSRMEMLEIASYGHKLRSITNRSMSRQRRRAESIGHRESVRSSEARDSFVFDESSPGVQSPMVLDEAPLTDMEVDVDTETDREQTSYSYSPNGESRQLPQAQQPPFERPKRINHTATQSGSSQSTVTKVIPTTPKKRQQPSQIPRATPQAPSRTTGVMQRTASAPLTALSASSSPNTSSNSTPSGVQSRKMAQSQSQPVSSPVAQKRGRPSGAKAQMPASPAAKKAKSMGATKQQQQRSKSLAGLRSQPRDVEVGEYPDMLPDGFESMADAIPSWTEPKKAGNWDDVVLPAVARKMGLEDHYEEADGSPKQPRQSEEVIPPQPGTFGIDSSKSRSRMQGAGDMGENIQMDVFGSPGSPNEGDTKKGKRSSKRNSNANNTNNSNIGNNTNKQRIPPIDTCVAQKNNSGGNGIRMSPPPSPAPFSQYARANTGTGTDVMEEFDVGRQKMVEEEGTGAACCRCIIM